MADDQVTAPSGAMSSLSDIAKCLVSIQKDIETLANFKTSAELDLSDLRARIGNNSDFINDMSIEVNDNKQNITIVGKQSDSVLQQLQDSSALTAMDMQINSLTQMISTKDITATCANLAVFGLVGDAAAIKEQFSLVFGPLLDPGGLLSQSHIKSIETVDLSRSSAASAPRAVVIMAKSNESSIKIISRMQILLRQAIDSHGGRKAESNPYKSANVGAFFEKSIMPLRSVLREKANFLKERFTWIKHVRIQLERRQFRLALIVTPNEQVKDSLKMRNLLPFAELKVGISIEAISHFDNLPWKKMRELHDASGPAAPAPPQVAPPVLAGPPAAVADNFNDEIELISPSPDTVTMDTENEFLPPILPVLSPRTTPAGGVAAGGHTAEKPSPQPLTKELNHLKNTRGRSRSKIGREKWGIEPSPKRVRSSSSSKSNVSDSSQPRKKPLPPLSKATADSEMPPPPAPTTPTSSSGPPTLGAPTNSSTRAKQKPPGPSSATTTTTQRSLSLSSSKLPPGRM